MTTSEPLPSGGNASPAHGSMSSAEGHPASPSPTSGSASVSETTVGVGRGWQMSYAQWDRGTSSWRTFQGSFEMLMPSAGSSVTFTSSGSMRSGLLSRRASWVHHIHVSACSWWPTPRATMANNLCTYRPQFRTDAPALEQRVAMRGQTGGYLNPDFVEWLMGFPRGWTRSD